MNLSRFGAVWEAPKQEMILSRYGALGCFTNPIWRMGSWRSSGGAVMPRGAPGYLCVWYEVQIEQASLISHNGAQSLDLILTHHRLNKPVGRPAAFAIGLYYCTLTGCARCFLCINSCINSRHALIKCRLHTRCCQITVIWLKA